MTDNYDQYLDDNGERTRGGIERRAKEDIAKGWGLREQEPNETRDEYDIYRNEYYRNNS